MDLFHWTRFNIHMSSQFSTVKCLNYSYASGGGCVRLQHLQLFGTVRNIPTHLLIGCLLCILGLWRVRNIPTHFQFFSITARSRATCWELVLCLNYSDVEQTPNRARHSHMLFFQGRVPPEGPPPFLNFSGGSGGNFCKLPGESRLMGLASRPQKPAEYLLLFPE